MFTEVSEAIKTSLEAQVNAAEIQAGYYGDMDEVDLRAPAVMIEVRRDRSDGSGSTRWNPRRLELRIWIMVGMARSYQMHLQELEHLIGADGEDVTGITSALIKLKRSGEFGGLTGSMGGKIWRIRQPVMELQDTTFGVVVRGSEKVLAAQVELAVLIEVER